MRLSTGSSPFTPVSEAMASILAFGDSLTWGRDPAGSGRHALADRWPSVLATGLPGFEIAAEGLRGRLTAFDQMASPADANGVRVLPTLLHSHAPLDLVIVMLGTNDIYYGHLPTRVGDGMQRIVEVIRGHAYRIDCPAPDILLVSPPTLVKCADATITDEAIVRSQKLPDIISDVAKRAGTGYFDAAAVARCSPTDGCHLDAAATRALGHALIRPVQGMLAERAGRA